MGQYVAEVHQCTTPTLCKFSSLASKTVRCMYSIKVYWSMTPMHFFLLPLQASLLLPPPTPLWQRHTRYSRSPSRAMQLPPATRVQGLPWPSGPKCRTTQASCALWPRRLPIQWSYWWSQPRFKSMSWSLCPTRLRCREWWQWDNIPHLETLWVPRLDPDLLFSLSCRTIRK